MKTTYAVKFIKFFVNGNLENLAHNSVLTFATLEAAAEYVSFCHAHRNKPVSSVGGPDYTIHGAFITAVDSLK